MLPYPWTLRIKFQRGSNPEARGFLSHRPFNLSSIPDSRFQTETKGFPSVGQEHPSRGYPGWDVTIGMRTISEQKVGRADVAPGWSSRTMRVTRLIGGILFFALLYNPVQALSAWYVDSSVAASGNGASWATAWKTLSNVSGVKAGDTVYISGGASGSSLTYSVSGWKPAGGSSGAPIVYQIGQDGAHNGTAVFSGSGTWLTGVNYCTVSGDAGDGKMHFALSGYGGAATVGNTTGLRISYVNFGSIGDAAVDGQGVTGFRLDHCWCTITSGSADHFMSVGFNDTTWDGSVMDGNTVYVPHQTGAAGDGADGFQLGGNGYTMTNNFVVGYDMTYTGGQHQDGWQGLGNNYIRFCGNTFVNIGNYALFADAYYGGFSHVRVCNNIFLMSNPINPGGIVFGTDGGYVGPSPCTFSDILFANNAADGYGNNGSYTLNNVTGSSHPTTFTGCTIINNVSVNGGYISTDGNTTSTIINNATLTTAQGAADFVKYTVTGGTNNDFHLLAAATALIGHATNELSYFTADKDGKARPVTGNWDMGPYQYGSGVTTNTPLIRVTPGNIAYGTILRGTSATNSFVVANAGAGTLSGTASVVGGPFSVVSGGSYSLGSNQSQTVTVVFSPTVASNYTQTVTLTGGGGTNAILSGSVLTALPGVQFRLTPAKQFILTVAGQNGHTYNIQATQDFKTWTVIGTVTMGVSGSLDFTDTNAANFSRRFYRTQE